MASSSARLGDLDELMLGLFGLGLELFHLARDAAGADVLVFLQLSVGRHEIATQHLGLVLGLAQGRGRLGIAAAATLFGDVENEEDDGEDGGREEREHTRRARQKVLEHCHSLTYSFS